MKSCWLHKKKSRCLLVFCNGWGMDETPFTRLDSNEYDILVFYDYQDLQPDFEVDLLASEYEELILAGWSMGVVVGQLLFQKNKEMFQKRIAINGTLCPIDDRFGIPRDTFQATHDNYNEATRLKFYRRMCREKSILKE